MSHPSEQLLLAQILVSLRHIVNFYSFNVHHLIVRNYTSWNWLMPAKQQKLFHDRNKEGERMPHQQAKGKTIR